MSAKPSWLEDEDNRAAAVSGAKAIAKNPIAQKVASDPQVHKAVAQSVANSVSESNQPSWATYYEPPAVPGVPIADVENQRRQASTASQIQAPEGETFECDPETLKQMQNWHLALRIAYMIAAIIMAAAAGVILTKTPNVGQAFFAIYVLFFSLMIFCFEVGLDVS